MEKSEIPKSRGRVTLHRANQGKHMFGNLREFVDFSLFRHFRAGTSYGFWFDGSEIYLMFIFEEYVYLNAGNGCACAGQSSENWLSDLVEMSCLKASGNFGAAPPMGSSFPEK